MNNLERIAEIEHRLRKALRPLQLQIIDDSEKHRGHPGAQDGRSHFTVNITAQAFKNQSPIQCHRLVYDALGDLMTTDIHALQINAKPIDTQALIDLVKETLSNQKAVDIKTIDVTQLTQMIDAFVICTATSVRHAASIGDKLVDAVKKVGVRPLNRVDDQADTGWILIDLLDVVVHIMLAETREFYSLEKLWTMSESTRHSQENAD